MRQSSPLRSLVILLTALGVSFALSACNGDDSSTRPANTSDSSQADKPKDASNCSLDVPSDVADFPVPDSCTVMAASDVTGTWRVVLGDMSGGVEDAQSFYQDRLVKQGWRINDERPSEDDLSKKMKFGATKKDMKLNLDIRYRKDIESTGVSIELVRG